MKEQELNNLLDKAIGTKGNLRIPSFWMRKVFSALMEWAKSLTPKVDVPTKISQLENDTGVVTESYVNEQITIANNYTDSAISSAISKTLNIPV